MLQGAGHAMELMRIAVRALATGIYLLVMTRLTGKRVVSQATPFDLVVALIIGDMIDNAIWGDVPMAEFAAGAGTIFVTDIALTFAAFRSKRVARLILGAPVVAVRDGRPDLPSLRREQMNGEDLEHLLRIRGLGAPDQARLALVEIDHQLSVLWKPGDEAARREDAEAVRGLLETHT